ncbi:hypothetical protein BKA62DRAFT_676543 [Auriculariales sp. MPI-PUGE-AT-0066]|nr:hypothetical protein BKA62DRAFT_676543 [Auriculariales sp. MPI-PUGE-AT-0066]
MPPKKAGIVELARKGLAMLLKEGTQKRRDEIHSRLKRSEPVSDANLEFIDNTANHVDEEQLVNKLEKAADVNEVVENLAPQEKNLFQTLKKLAGGIGTVVDKIVGKRKRTLIPDRLKCS